MLGRVRAAFRVLTSVLFVAIVVQVGLAGWGAFRAVHDAKPAPISQKSIESGFDAHVALGYVIVVAMLAMLLVASIGRLEATKVKLVAGLLVLGVVQAILGTASESVPAIGPVHAINALAIYALAGLLAHRTWTENRPKKRSSAASSPVTAAT
jgi:hypothetical protein